MKFLITFLLIIAISAWLQAQKFEEPQWQMPLYFEDATGQKDMVWLGYDPDAGIMGMILARSLEKNGCG